MKASLVRASLLALGLNASLWALAPASKAEPPPAFECLYESCERSGHVVEATLLSFNAETLEVRARVDQVHLTGADGFLVPELGDTLTLSVVSDDYAIGQPLLLVSPKNSSPDVSSEDRSNSWTLIPIFDQGMVGCRDDVAEWVVPLETFLELMRLEGDCYSYRLPVYSYGPHCQGGSTAMALWGLGALGLLLWRRQGASRDAA